MFYTPIARCFEMVMRMNWYGVEQFWLHAKLYERFA